MKIGRILAVLVAGVTVALIVEGTLWPNPPAVALAGGDNVLRTPSTPEAAIGNLAQNIGHQDWGKPTPVSATRRNLLNKSLCTT